MNILLDSRESMDNRGVFGERLQHMCRDVCMCAEESLLVCSPHTLFHLTPSDAAHVLISSKSEAWKDNVGRMMGAR